MQNKELEGRPSAADLSGPEGFFAGPWRILPDRNRVEKEGREASLEPRVMDVLVLLAARAGEVVSRAELLDAVWGNRVVNEEALTRAVWEIRNALGDDPKRPEFVETIRKGGYRWIAPVRPAAPPEAPASPPRPIRDRSRLAGFAGVLIVGAATILAALIGRDGGDDPPPAPSTLAGVPFTSFRGVESTPAFSPDGARVAFAWTGDEGEDTDIYVKQRNTETPLRLTDHPANESFPAWSPDGSEVAFFRGGDEMGIYAVPSIGGPARRLVGTRVSVQGLDWSPDGGFIAYSGWVDGDRPPQIDILSLENGETWALTRPEKKSSCDFSPRFSPDGETIAFVRSGPIYHQSIHVVPVRGGEEERLVFGRGRVMGMDWAQDGKSLVFSSAPSVDYSLWRVSLGDRSVRWLPTKGKIAIHPAISPAGGLVYEERSQTSDIWRVRLEEGGAVVDEAPVIASTRSDYAPAWSPEGDRIAFVSTRSGDRQIWLAGADGSDPRPLTALEGLFLLPPVWSPGGDSILFSATPEECSVLFVVDVDGGELGRIGSSDVCHEIANLWSGKGGWIYFERGAGSEWGIRKIRPDGSGESLLVPRPGAVQFEGENGDLVYHRIEEGGLWRVPASGGAEECLVPAEAMAYWNDWAVTEGGVYFTRFASGGDVLGFLDRATGETRLVARLPGSGAGGLAVSPGGDELLFALPGPAKGDLILVEDFR